MSECLFQELESNCFFFVVVVEKGAVEERTGSRGGEQEMTMVVGSRGWQVQWREERQASIAG